MASKKTTDDTKKTSCKNEMKVGNLVINISCLTADENVNQSLWLNIGISSDNTFVDKILSTCIVADYIYRIVMQDKDKQGMNDLKEFNCQKKSIAHPFSVVIDHHYSALDLSKQVRLQIESTYNYLCDQVADNFGCKFDQYKTFLRKLSYARGIIYKFANMLVTNEVITGSSIKVTEFMKSKTHVLSTMLRKKRKTCSFQSNPKIYMEAITYDDYILCENNTAPDLKAVCQASQKNTVNLKQQKRKNPSLGSPSSRKKTHSDHKWEDKNIPKDIPVIIKPKPGYSNQCYPILCHSKRQSQKKSICWRSKII